MVSPSPDKDVAFFATTAWIAGLAGTCEQSKHVEMDP